MHLNILKPIFAKVLKETLIIKGFSIIATKSNSYLHPALIALSWKKKSRIILIM